MNLLKKWLFPILTCLIVIGAAVLPAYISQVKDNRQFAQIHTSELNADALAVREGRDLLGRLELYARWNTMSDIIPSFQTVPEDEKLENVELAEQTLTHALDYLIQAGVLPDYLLELPLEYLNVSRVLLWDPDDMSSWNLAEYWSVTTGLGEDSLWIMIDSESGLPLTLNLYDPNMARWLEYKDPNTLPDMAAQFFELLGLKTEHTEAYPPSDTEHYFVIEGTEIQYCFSFNATMLDIRLEKKDDTRVRINSQSN